MTNKNKSSKTKTEEKDQKDTKSEPQPKYREKKQIPPVSYLLQYGADEDADREPQTFLQSLVLPGLLLLTFVVSLALFHIATDGFKGGNHGKGTDGPRYKSFQQKFADKEF
mmetsp:Transcript_2592/g.3458  ORF Transcript_2592/g.3458 Transcript_2592/m.3458 type:complete len:111 (-) Transcript_2592:231-563(-)